MGEFTVCSVYKLLLQGNFNNPNNYNPIDNTTCYKKLWNLNLPFKIKITAWKTTFSYLPTLVNLRTKRLTTEAVYPRCMQRLETREHIFYDCSITKEIWKNLDYVWSQELLQFEFMDWFTWVLLNSRVDVCRIFVYAIYVI